MIMSQDPDITIPRKQNLNKYSDKVYHRIKRLMFQLKYYN